MSGHEPFLEAIRGEPDEDVHRLVFADWLEEHGDPDRAELIRVQCDLARLPNDDPRRAELEVREIRLLAEHAAEWAAPWPAFGNWWYAGDEALRAVFRRGFIEVIDVAGFPASTLVPDGPLARMFAAHPIRELSVVTRDLGDLGPFAGWEGLRRVESLSVRQYAHGGAPDSPRQAREIETLLRSANLVRLRKLAIGLWPTPGEVGARWLRLPVIAQLIALTGQSPGFGGEAVRELARGAFPHLRELELPGRPLGPTEAAELVASPTWKQLSGVTVHHPLFPWPQALAGANLTRLTVFAWGEGDRQHLSTLAAGLVNATGAPCLEELQLRYGAFHGEELSSVLAASGALAGLRRFTGEGLTDGDLERLAWGPALAGIERLTLGLDRKVSDRGLCALLSSPRLRAATHLILRGGQVSPKAAAALADNEACRRLRVLSLGQPTNSAVLAALTQGEPFPELHTVRLDSWRPPLEPKALEAFLSSPKLPRLCAVPFCAETEDVKRFAEVFRRCPRIAWAGGVMVDGGDGVRVALAPENVYLPIHLAQLAELE
jgi:uncharacterized protein (TIGR02996 family)